MKLSIAFSTTPRLVGVTELCLKSIRLFPPSCEHEVLVALPEYKVNDAGEEWYRLRALIQEAGATPVFCDSDHPPIKGNRLFSQCSGDLICSLTADVVVSPRFFDLYLEYYRFSEAYQFRIGMTGTYTTNLPGLQQDVSVTAHKRHIEVVPRVIGTTWLFKKSVFQEVGGLDEKCPVDMCTDDDLCYRMNMAGYTNLLFPMVALHMGRVSFKNDEEAQRDIELGDRYLTEKHGAGWRNSWAALSEQASGLKKC